MPGILFRRNTLALVIVATLAALVLRSALRLWLERQGTSDLVAADLSYLAVPPILAILTVPLWRDARIHVAWFYRHTALSLNVVFSAILIGLLMRLTWWAATFSRVSFGWFAHPVAAESVGPAFGWQCPASAILLLGIVVMAGIVPVVEETIHRGYLFTAAKRWGLPAAAVVSALTFMVLHNLDGWATAFGAGLVFAVQFHRTQSLWSSTISHATFNLLVQFDWRCLTGQWRPSVAELPLLSVGIPCLVVALACTLMIVWLLSRRRPERTLAPDADG